MGISRREFVKLATASGIALSFSRAAFAESLAFDARETLPGNQQLESRRDRARAHRRPGQGHRVQTLRLRFSCRRSSGLAAEYVARFADPRDGRDACLHRRRSLAIERCARTVARGDGGRSCRRRHPGAGLLCGRPVLPDRQDAALSRPAAGHADLRAVRRLRSGPPGIA